jgi:glycosyltransferase involved in cell wall biosynthesis
LDVLLEAWSVLQSSFPNARLSVVGDGAIRADYEAQALNLGLGERVRFLGAVPPGPCVYDLMSTHDLLVLPSRREGLPRVLIEAMAVGLPCISTNVCGAGELLAEEDRVAIGNAEGLARAVSEMLSCRRRRLEAGVRNARVARRFCDELLQVERRRFYEALVDASRHARTTSAGSFL